MNKKGFTLVELLATIIILAVLMTIITMSALGVVRRSNQRTYEMLKYEILSAAETYRIEQGIRILYVEDLIEKGYIESDNGVVTNPLNGNRMNCYPIEVNMVRGRYVAEFANNLENFVNDGTTPCDRDTFIGNNNLSISVIGNTYVVTCGYSGLHRITNNHGYFREFNCTGSFSNSFSSIEPVVFTVSTIVQRNGRNVIVSAQSD